MNNDKCFDIFFFLCIIFLFVIYCWRFSTHLKEFASHRARRWYYHATTFLVSRFWAARPLATLGFLQFGAETIAVFSNRSPNVSTTWPWKVVKVKRERHGRKRRNQWDFQRNTITGVSRVPKSHVPPFWS